MFFVALAGLVAARPCCQGTSRYGAASAAAGGRGPTAGLGALDGNRLVPLLSSAEIEGLGFVVERDVAASYGRRRR